MSEWPSREDDQEAQEVSERSARFRAMPVRTIVSLEAGGALLDCGHWATFAVRLKVGDFVRCRDCYEQGMEKAREMMERSSI